MAAFFAINSGKAVEENSAIQISLQNLFDLGAKGPVYSFKTLVIDLFEGFKVVFNATIV
jgi:hypothetical protein